jgi:hypothetical protein
MSTAQIIEQDISSILGIDDMPEAEQALFLNDIGALMLEGALLKFLVTIGDDDQESLLAWMEHEIASPNLLTDLMHRYPAFEAFLTEEIKTFKEDAVRVLSQSPQE